MITENINHQPKLKPLVAETTLLKRSKKKLISTHKKDCERDNRSLTSSVSSLGYNPGPQSPIDNYVPEDLSDDEDNGSVSDHDDDEVGFPMINPSTSVDTKPIMHRRNSLGLELAKRNATINSIKWLGRHIPTCALSQISDEVLQLTKNDGDQKPIELPRATTYRSALLFIDMSGFTKLSQNLDVENLSKAINSYFQAIVDIVTDHGGDILKFAGDAIFAEWRADQDDKKNSPTKNTRSSQKSTRGRRASAPDTYKRKTDEAPARTRRRASTTPHRKRDRRPSVARARTTSRKRQQQNQQQQQDEKPKISLEDCVHAAAMCGAMVVNKCADYPIYNKSVTGGQGSLVATLNVHCGLGAGKTAGVHVGNEYNRREYLIIGDAIEQVSEACGSAKLGELRASSEALQHLNKGQPFKNQLHLEKGAKSRVVASRRKIFFSKKRAWTLDGRIRKQSKPKHKATIPFEKMDLVSLKYLHKILSFYVHPVVVGDETAQVNNPSSRDGLVAQERHRAEAELRSVFTIFIMPKVNAKLSDDPIENKKTFNRLNDIMNVVTSILHSFKGHLRQYIVDDKGVVLIATFGLRGSTFPNMVPERALPTCRIIHSVLHTELGIESQIGATLGKVYCGVVGGVKRHEFAVLGPSVNLSARLMSQKNHPGVLVDNAVRHKAKGMNFISFPPVKAKGYRDPVPVFKPLTAKEARWGKVNPKFVGRKKEIKMVCNLALKMAKEDSPSKVVFVWGESGSGKSAFVVHAIAKARKNLMTNRKSVVVTRNISSEGDSLVPFSLFRSIFRDVLGEKPMSDEATSSSRISKSYHTRDWDAASIGSVSTLSTQKTSVVGRLQELCEELRAPKGFLEIVGQHLLGDTKGKMSKVEKAPELEDIISFMAQVFIRSTAHVEVVILALDDVQWMDSLSWKVVQCILETSKNILIVCGSRPKESHPLAIDEDLKRKISGEYRDKKLYLEMSISALRLVDVREMAAITLSCEPSDVDDNFCNDVFIHSGGMPYFASEILEECTRKNQTERLKNGKVGWSTITLNRDGLKFDNIEDLFLQRLDNLDDVTRKILQFAAVLGMSFSSSEIMEISEHIQAVSPDEKEGHDQKIRNALKTAVKQGILDETVIDDLDDNGSTGSVVTMMVDITGVKDGSHHGHLGESTYFFYHDTWRRVIISLLLDSWIRDIHKHAAMAIEARVPEDEMRDYRTKVKLFRHWKGSENTINASKIALDIGKSFKDLGMNYQSIRVYQDAIDMWKRHKSTDEKAAVAGFAPEVLDSLDKSNLVQLVKLQTALGQASGSIYEGDLSNSASAYNDALEVLRFAPVSAEIKDRAFIFPIYSGLFFLMKYGAICDPSEQVAYEVDLTAKFVSETERHGDPVHYGRALAMQGETYHRLGNFKEAIQSHLKLKEIYNVDKHSALVVAEYASDRCAQNYGCAANCYMRLGKKKAALEIADYIEHQLMPKMDPKNVHNSVVMVMPILWILKDNGEARRARCIFKRYVLDPFAKYFGEDGSTPFLAAFRPIEILMNIVVAMESKEDSIDKSYYDWALDFNNMKISMKLDVGIGNFGRSAMSTSSEICLRLSKLTKDRKKKAILIDNGMKLANLAISGCDGLDGSSKNLTAYNQIKPVYDQLKKLLPPQ